ncbi:nuclear transport factor 2 family protein [Symbioplanes lichenis]|uniref:nuclear transport factor 2 family protein n=1 Tax=Symbioplanes lichenis TaxID=1629072 RepID=UPI002738BC56|nr:nuclear transport factor 2 family protein [Actinoplanes lichenis]
MGYDRNAAHIDRFNTAVRTGDWSPVVAALHPDAVMTFTPVPAGPFTGRAAIAAAYAENPPDDTMRVVSVDGNTVLFEWSRGGTGTLSLRWAAGLISRLDVRFLD